jgi:hypothetical protein
MDATQTPPPAPKGRYRSYADVPWLRKSGTNTAFILIHLLTCGCVPLLLLTCIILVTGDVYYNRRDREGNLEAWSMANKVVAMLILLFNVVLVGAAFVATLFP